MHARQGWGFVDGGRRTHVCDYAASPLQRTAPLQPRLGSQHHSTVSGCGGIAQGTWQEILPQKIALGEAAGARGRRMRVCRSRAWTTGQLRYGWPWTVDQQFNVGVEGARQDSLGGMLDHRGGGPDLGRGVTF